MQGQQGLLNHILGILLAQLVTREAFRDHAAQTYRNNEIGFRCAVSP